MSSQISSMKSSRSLLSTILYILSSVFGLGLIVAAALVMQAPAGSTVNTFVKWLFATDSVQLMWYITRASGLTAYLVLWLSVAWGLAVSSKILDNLLHRAFTYDFHQFLSLLGIGFIAVHLISLMFDRYLPYSVVQLLVPGVSTYRPIWVAVGIIAFYLTVLVTVTFYMRGKIGMKAFRVIHVFSLVAYLATAVHGLMAGTDASLFFVQVMYAGTFLLTIFLIAYWLIILATKNRAFSPARLNQRQN